MSFKLVIDYLNKQKYIKNYYFKKNRLYIILNKNFIDLNEIDKYNFLNDILDFDNDLKYKFNIIYGNYSDKIIICKEKLKEY